MKATNGFERRAAAIRENGRVEVVGSHTWQSDDSQTVSGVVAGTFQMGGPLYLSTPVGTRRELAAAFRLARRLKIALAVYWSTKGDLLAWYTARAECRIVAGRR